MATGFPIPGMFDRKVEIQYPKRTKNGMGEDEVEWKPFATVWAKAAPLMAKERFLADSERATREYTFTIRYRKGIGPEMRIVHDSLPYQIKGIAEIGRRRGLELTAEYMEANGQS